MQQKNSKLVYLECRSKSNVLVRRALVEREQLDEFQEWYKEVDPTLEWHVVTPPPQERLLFRLQWVKSSKFNLVRW